MKKAFTLAEVLITLTIIGVIAALTIPTLMRKWQDHADVVKVKRIYTKLEQAINLLVVENNNDDLFSLGYPPTSTKAPNVYFYERLKPYLKVYKNCNTWLLFNGICTSRNVINSYKDLKGDTGSLLSYNNDNYSVILQDGTVLVFIRDNWKTAPITNYATGNPKPYVGNIDVDINGFDKGPNRYGYDVFRFLIGERGLFWPSPNLTYLGGYWPPAKNTTHKDNCKPNSSGTSCAYWVIKHGNMDYKYRDVSAEW